MNAELPQRAAAPHTTARSGLRQTVNSPGDRSPGTGPQSPSARDGFDRRLFIDTIAVLAMVAVPTVLIAAALLHRPLILVALALVAPALLAIPVALEGRHAHSQPPTAPSRRRGRGPLL
jgi:hypothetical protein